MRKLKFEYSMELKFSSPVNSHYFALRCIPGDSLRQKITLAGCRVSPADYTAVDRDGFGNMKISGCCRDYHDTFGYSVTGVADVEGMMVQKCPLHPIYRYPSKYTQIESEVREFAETAWKESGADREGNTLYKAVCVMGYLYHHFTYASGTTDIRTTAAEALRIGKGVCQDYAHILTAVMRYKGIPARYVNGLMIGEGATHAWVEIYIDNGWYGLDPTNNLHVDDYYIKLAHGRDYGDCEVDRGIFRGNAVQRQRIYVNVEEIRNDRDCCVNGTSGR